MDSVSERENLERRQLDRLSKQKLAPGVERKLILALDVQLVMPHAHCARNVDISQLCGSQASSVNRSNRGRLGRLVSFSWSSSRYIVGVDKEDIHRRHSSHYESRYLS